MPPFKHSADSGIYQRQKKREKTTGTFYISLVFSAGILLSIAAIGIITASMGRLMGDIGSTGNYIVAIIFFIMGLYLMDIINLNWGAKNYEPGSRNELAAALLLGLVFGIALGPCTFAFMAPVLGVVFQISQNNFTGAIFILSAFAIGHCIVIASAGTLAGRVQNYLNWSGKNKILILLKRICGALVFISGIYLLYTTY